MRYYIQLFLFILIFQFDSSAQCSLRDTIINIPDDETPIAIQLVIEGVLNNNLADPNQCVDSVLLKFEHKQRTDLTVNLFSPSSQSVTLVGPYDPFNKPLTTVLKWNIKFVRCSAVANPDPGKSDVFDNNDNWGIGNQFVGSYYPNNNCLEDFNFGPVNGTWTFLVHDHQMFDTGRIKGYAIRFCDGTTAQCSPCKANAGNFQSDTIVICDNDPNKNLYLSNVYLGSKPDTTKYVYKYYYLKNNQKFSVSSKLDIQNLSTGSYKIYGISYHKIDSFKVSSLYNTTSDFFNFKDNIENISNPFCADITDTCLIINILPVIDSDTIEISLCEGQTYVFHNQTLSQEGSYFFNGLNGKCDSTFLIKITLNKLNAGIVANDTLISCSNNGKVKLHGTGFKAGSGMSFKWLELPGLNDTIIEVGQKGLYHFIVYSGNCTDTASVLITADTQIPEINYIVENINCSHPIGKITTNISNTSISKYTWTFNSLVLPQNTNVINVNQAGNYHLEVLSTAGCSASLDILVIKDTIVPHGNITFNDITCIQDTSFLNFSSHDNLISITWTPSGQSSKNIFVLDSGVYKVHYVAINGCENTDSVKVLKLKDKPANVDIEDTLKIDCEQISVSLSPKTIDSNYQYYWYGGPNIDTFKLYNPTVTDAGDYFLHVTNQYGCTNTFGPVKVILDNKKPDITFLPLPDFILSCGETAMTLNYSSTIQIDSSIWTGPGKYFSTLSAPVIEVGGRYYLTTIGHNKCISVDTIDIEYDNDVPQFNILNDTIDCIDNTLNLTAIYSSNYSFTWKDENSAIYTGNTISSTVAGYYFITVTDNTNNCSNVFLHYAPSNTNPVNVHITPSSPMLDCNHTSVQLSFTSDVKPKQVKWYDANNILINDPLNIIVPGKYFCYVLGENYCEDTDSIDILSGNFLTLEQDTLYLTCKDQSINLLLPGIDPNYSYSWIGPNLNSNISSPIVNTPGEYLVTVTGGNCTSSTVITVLEDKIPPQIDIDYNPVIYCNPNYSYIHGKILSGIIDSFYWSGPNNYHSTDLDNNVIDPGTYFFNVIGKNGCKSSRSATITRSAQFNSVITKGDTLTCTTGIHPLSVSAQIVGDYTNVIWQGPDGSYFFDKEINVFLPGKYKFEVHNSDGCITKDSAFVVIDTLKPYIDIPNPDILTCKSPSLTISPYINITNPQIQWFGPNSYFSQNKDIIISNFGKYFVTITGQNGCSTIDSIDIKVNKIKPYMDILGENLTGCSSKVTLKVRTNILDYNTLWKSPDGSIVNAKDSIRINQAGTYNVTLTDNTNGCSSIDSISITYDTLRPPIYTNNYFLNCDGSDIKMVVYSDEFSTKFTWIGPNGYYQTGSVVYTHTPGTYYIYATGKNCLNNLDSILVSESNVKPRFDIVASNIDCSDHKAILNAYGVFDDLSFVWNGPNGFISTLANPEVGTPGKYSLKVIGENYCDSTAYVDVIADTLKPKINLISEGDLQCEKAFTHLSVNVTNVQTNELFSYEWTTTNGQIDYGKYSDKVTVISKGTYKVKVKNQRNRCTVSDTISVLNSSYSLDSIKFNIKKPTCFGFADGEIRIDTAFGGTAPYRYSIDNNYFSNIRLFNSRKAGTYSFYAKDANGCETDTIVLMPEGNDVEVGINVSKDKIYAGDSLIVEAEILAPNGISLIDWTPEELIFTNNASNAIIYPKKSLYISCNVVDSLGCKNSDRVWIEVLNRPDIYFPNVFTPDGNNIDDYYYIRVKDGVSAIKKFKIFDRWGELLYSKDNPRINVGIDGWNGQFNGYHVESGVFVVYVLIELKNGKTEEFYSDFTLLK